MNSARIDPSTAGRPYPRPDLRENMAILGNLIHDLYFSQIPLKCRIASIITTWYRVGSKFIIHKYPSYPSIAAEISEKPLYFDYPAT